LSSSSTQKQAVSATSAAASAPRFPRDPPPSGSDLCRIQIFNSTSM
jgi:hypothetical protein